MNWPTMFAALVLAVTPVVAQSQRSASDDFKGRTITVRACVAYGIGNAVVLNKFTDITAGENATTSSVRAKRVVYWFSKPADIKELTGRLIEVSASVAEATEDEVELTAFDVVGELEGGPTSVPVANATAASSDVPDMITLKLEVSRVRQLTSCR